MRKDVKDMRNKRKIAFVYLMHRMFEGNPVMMLKILNIPKANISVEDLKDWDMDYREAVYQTIEEEDCRGVELRDPTSEVPSIKSIKEKMLRRVNAVISATDDPSKLAQAYKILSDFETVDDKKEKTVIDAINEGVKPLTKKQKEHITMLEKMRLEDIESRFQSTDKPKRGRPKKVKNTDPLFDGNRVVEEEAVEDNEEND